MADEKRARATFRECRATIERTKDRIESSMKLLNKIEELQRKKAGKKTQR
jgi:hypothetical protein